MSVSLQVCFLCIYSLVSSNALMYVNALMCVNNFLCKFKCVSICIYIYIILFNISPMIPIQVLIDQDKCIFGYILSCIFIVMIISILRVVLKVFIKE